MVRRTPRPAGREFGIGVGTLILAVNVILLACYSWGCHVMRHVVGGRCDEMSTRPSCDVAYTCVSALNRKHMLFAWLSLFSVAFADVYIRLCSMGIWTDVRIFLMGAPAAYTYDVLIVGAGGAGLRAAIEAAGTGVTVGLICKSLLGKAHTVMAEGGIAAAMANVDERDGWQVHFADTMRGGQDVNNWRMAQLHAMEAPDCDSLDTVELVMALEEEFGIEIPDEDAEKITRVKEAVEYIEKHGDKAKK